MRITKLLFVLLIFCITFTFAQKAFTEQYSAAVTLNGNMVSSSGSLYKDRGAVIEVVNVTASGNIFVVDNIYTGLAVDYREETKGNSSESVTFFGINAGYTLNAIDGALFPYVNASLKIANYSYGKILFLNGPSYSIGAGAIVPIAKHVGFNIDIGYNAIKVEDKLDDSESGSNLLIKLGISGLIF